MIMDSPSARCGKLIDAADSNDKSFERTPVYTKRPTSEEAGRFKSLFPLSGLATAAECEASKAKKTKQSTRWLRNWAITHGKGEVTITGGNG